MWNMIWPIAVVVIANTMYNICAKSAPAGTNAFVGLFVTYVISAAASLILFFVTQHGGSLLAEIRKINWVYIVLGIVLVALEFGYICVYRAGWQVNTAPLVANITLAVVLVIVGAVVFREALTLRKVIGIVVCAAGVILMSK